MLLNQQIELYETFGKHFCLRPVAVNKAGEPPYYRRCKTRNINLCRYCAVIARNDLDTVLMSGCEEDEDNAQNHYYFVTLTAPGLNLKTHYVNNTDGEGVTIGDDVRRCACRKIHLNDELNIMGTPVHADNFDYKAVVDWNFFASKLMNATITAVRRVFPSFSYASCRELQTRLVAHYHLLCRINKADCVGRDVIEDIQNVVAGVATKNGLKWGEHVDVQHVDNIGSGVVDYFQKTVHYMIKGQVKPFSPAQQTYYDKLCEYRENAGLSRRSFNFARQGKSHEAWSLEGLTLTKLAKMKAAGKDNEPMPSWQVVVGKAVEAGKNFEDVVELVQNESGTTNRIKKIDVKQFVCDWLELPDIEAFF